MEQIVSPKFEGLHDGLELPVIIGIPSFGFTKLFTEEGNRVKLLR